MPKPRGPDSKLVSILQLICQHDKITRPRLTELTGYSTFLVSKLCEKLMAADLIAITESHASAGGRRPGLLAIEPGLGKLVGVDLGTVNARIALTDMNGGLIKYQKFPSNVHEGPEASLRQMLDEIQLMLGKEKIDPRDVCGIGVGISAVLDRSMGTTRSWPKVPRWTNIPVRQIIHDHFKTVVEVDDSVRTAALVERRVGGASCARHFIYINIGAGTGSALFLNNELYTGNAGFAGEFGHTTVDESGPPCTCGGRGCVEALASGSAILRAAKEGLLAGASTILSEMCERDPKSLSAEVIAEAARRQDRFCMNLLSRAGVDLGTAIVGLVNLLNPQLIVIGGGTALAAGDFFMDPIHRIVKERALDVDLPEIRLSTLHDSDWAQGGAFLVREKVVEARLHARLKSTKHHHHDLVQNTKLFVEKCPPLEAEDENL